MSLQGSTPRQSGTKMVVGVDGKSYGTIGGSLFEAAAIQESRSILGAAQSEMMGYELNGKAANAVGMICVGKAELLLDEISATMKGDASDATARLGSPDADLFNLIIWARKVLQTFNNGFDETIKIINSQLSEIKKLPLTAGLKDFQDRASKITSELDQCLQREDFFDFVPQVQQLASDLSKEIIKTIKLLIEERDETFAKEKQKLQATVEWNNLSEDTRTWFGRQCPHLCMAV